MCSTFAITNLRNLIGKGKNGREEGSAVIHGMPVPLQRFPGAVAESRFVEREMRPWYWSC